MSSERVLGKLEAVCIDETLYTHRVTPDICSEILPPRARASVFSENLNRLLLTPYSKIEVSFKAERKGRVPIAVGHGMNCGVHLGKARWETLSRSLFGRAVGRSCKELANFLFIRF